jgi:hypothetical protein
MVGNTSISKTKFNIYTFKLTEKGAGYGLIDRPYPFIAADSDFAFATHPQSATLSLSPCSFTNHIQLDSVTEDDSQ